MSFSQETVQQHVKIALKEILNRKKITMVVTDSGLGGMSVCAGIEEKLKAAKSFEEVNLIFFNALPEKGIGYNSMPTFQDKAEVFDKALISMEKKFAPDLILIACNTLSVVYPFTQFASTSKTPVLDIVDFGVEMILSELKKNERSSVIIFGTQTTISAETHKKKLIASGINEQKIVCQACPGLESEIQDSPKSETVKGMIDIYLSEALDNVKNDDAPILAALCCTHYGFSTDIFRSSFDELTHRKVIILNPNELMINSMLFEDKRNLFDEIKVNVNVVSRAIIDDEEKKSIGELIRIQAPLSASALENYSYDPSLFDFSYTNEK